MAINRIDVKVGFQCNNRCLFCVQGNKRDLYDNRSTEELIKLLEEGRKQADYVVFTGGEPALRKDIVEVAKEARRLGYRQIQIQTNGRMLAYKELVASLIEAGVNEFSPAVHGHMADLHDYLTNAKGSFNQTIRGIRNVVSQGGMVITNTVITRSNFRHLPEIARLLVKLGVVQFQFAFVHPVGTVEQYFDSVVPRMTLISPYVKKGLNLGLALGRRAETEAIPYCFMKGFEGCVAEKRMPRTKVFDADCILEDYTEYRLTEGKAKGEPCKQCGFEPICEGPWREYPQRYGWREFKARTDSWEEVMGDSSG